MTSRSNNELDKIAEVASRAANDYSNNNDLDVSVSRNGDRSVVLYVFHEDGGSDPDAVVTYNAGSLEPSYRIDNTDLDLLVDLSTAVVDLIKDVQKRLDGELGRNKYSEMVMAVLSTKGNPKERQFAADCLSRPQEDRTVSFDLPHNAGVVSLQHATNGRFEAKVSFNGDEFSALIVNGADVTVDIEPWGMTSTMVRDKHVNLTNTLRGLGAGLTYITNLYNDIRDAFVDLIKD